MDHKKHSIAYFERKRRGSHTLRNNRLQKKVCYRCGRKRLPNRILCTLCRSKIIEYGRKYRKTKQYKKYYKKYLRKNKKKLHNRWTKYYKKTRNRKLDYDVKRRIAYKRAYYLWWF